VSNAPLVRIDDLTVRFAARGREVRAVNGVSLAVAEGETLGILGESGSGKSVTLRSLLRLLPPRRTNVEGSIHVAGEDVLAMTPSRLADYRGKVVSMIFQEPMLAFDPVFTIGDQIAEAIRRHDGVSADAARSRALDMLQRVRIPSAERRLAAFPHELSGGMRQRAMIALALACRPKLLLADEPTTALDATVQIQILLLLRELQREFGMAMIFVTHDIGVAVETSDRLAVMYAGRIVEIGAVRDVVRTPRHPYTAGLLRSRAHGAAKGQRLEAIPGAPPDLSNLPGGCSFAPRCRHAIDTCSDSSPALVDVTQAHAARCLRVADLASA
jgi:peptide/nickel transport system ATP-binding protein